MLIAAVRYPEKVAAGEDIVKECEKMKKKADDHQKEKLFDWVSTRGTGGLKMPPWRGLEYPMSNIDYMNVEVAIR